MKKLFTLIGVLTAIFSMYLMLLIADKSGYINLIDDLNVYENLKIALNKEDVKNEKKLMKDALKTVGFKDDILNKKIYTCSGGSSKELQLQD